MTASQSNSFSAVLSDYNPSWQQKHFSIKTSLNPYNLRHGHFYPHFLDEETKACRGDVAYPRPHSQRVAGLGVSSPYPTPCCTAGGDWGPA